MNLAHAARTALAATLLLALPVSGCAAVGAALLVDSLIPKSKPTPTPSPTPSPTPTPAPTATPSPTHT